MLTLNEQRNLFSPDYMIYPECKLFKLFFIRDTEIALNHSSQE